MKASTLTPLALLPSNYPQAIKPVYSPQRPHKLTPPYACWIPILFILKPQPRRWKNPYTLETLSSRNILIWIATPPLLWITTFLWVRIQHRRRDDSAYLRRSQAWPDASQSLKAAQKALKENNLPSANEALYQAITTYFGHRLNCHPGEVTCTRIIQAFPQEKVALSELIEAIELNRYSPSIPSQETIQIQFKTTSRLLQKCERTRL